jgi:hypothetical protein
VPPSSRHERYSTATVNLLLRRRYTVKTRRQRSTIRENCVAERAGIPRQEQAIWMAFRIPG